MLHQFEEYVYPGGFKAFFNQNIYGTRGPFRFPLTDHAVLIVNVLLGWGFYSMAAKAGAGALGFGAGLVGVSFVNGLAHSFLFVLKKKYNPGLITAFFGFLPFGCYFFYKLQAIMSPNDWTSAVTIAVVGTAMIPVGIFLVGQLAE